MTTAQFEAFLEECSSEVRNKQKKLIEAYGLNNYSKYRFNKKTKSLTFKKDNETELTFQITCIGSWAPKEKVWIWAWANENFPGEMREEASKLKELSLITGFEVFQRQGFDCEEIVARDLSYMAVHQLRAIGVYRIEAEESYVFLALMKCK